MIRALFFIVTVTVAFSAGYIVGNREAYRLDRVLAKARQEAAGRMSGLEREVKQLRIRIHLLAARHRLSLAETALSERNYGEVRKELNSAKEELAGAAERAERPFKETLSRFDSRLRDLIAEAARTDSRLRQNMESLRKDLEKTMEQSWRKTTALPADGNAHADADFRPAHPRLPEV